MQKTHVDQTIFHGAVTGVNVSSNAPVEAFNAVGTNKIVMCDTCSQKLRVSPKLGIVLGCQKCKTEYKVLATVGPVTPSRRWFR